MNSLKIRPAFFTAALFSGFLLSAVPVGAEDVSVSKNYRLSQTAAAPTVSFPPVVAKVNGVDISINRFWSGLLANAGQTVLSNMVDEILIEQAWDQTNSGAAKKGKKSQAQSKIETETDKKLELLKKQFSDEKTFLERLNAAGSSLEDLKRQIRIELYKEKLIEEKIKVSPAEIKKYFDENKAKLASPETIRLKHILVGSEQEAKDVLLALKVGANFELLAKEKSKDQSTSGKGGELGVFSQGMLIPELESKAFALPKDGLDIVKTSAGFHVIKVTEKSPAKSASWDSETQKAIENLLKQAKFNEEYPKYIQALRAKADIKVFLNQ